MNWCDTHKAGGCVECAIEQAMEEIVREIRNKRQVEGMEENMIQPKPGFWARMGSKWTRKK